MAKKYELTVIYGTEACEYYDGHTLEATKKKVDDNEVFGMVESYVFDTEKDRELAKQILFDADGWSVSDWEEKTIER